MAFSVDDQERIVTAMAVDLEFHDSHPNIRASDFDLPACRFVFDIVHRFREWSHMLPDSSAIASEAQLAVRGESKYTYDTVPSMDEAPAIARLLERISKGMSPSDLAQVHSMLFNYLHAVRCRQASRIASEKGMNEAEYAELLTEVHQDIVNGDTPQFDMSDACDVDDESMEAPVFRLPTGIEVLDSATNGGLAKGEIACLVAPSGLGKTTGMINFGANAARMGYHTLFITLENSKRVIRARWQAILGNYPMSRYNTPLSKWPEDERARFKALTDKKCPYCGRMTIVDGSKTTFTVRDIEQAIKAWKSKLRKNGKEDKGVAVYVDWLKQIDSTGCPGVNKQSRNDEHMTLVVRELGRLARDHEVVIWTAQQLNREGQTKEMASPKDIADATGIQNFLDLGISFGRPAITANNVQQTMDGTAQSINPETDRTMILGAFKSRNSDIVGRKMTVYQSPSLRIWKSKEEYTRIMRHVRNTDPRDLYELGGTV